MRRKRRKPEYDYDYMDALMAIMNAELVKEFNDLKSILAIDRVNAMSRVRYMYDDLGKLFRKIALKIAQYYYALGRRERAYSRWLDEQWIEDILTAFDPVSKYIFDNEEDRKRARLVEAMTANKENPAAEIDPAAKGLAWMYNLYAVRVADEAVVQAMKDDNIGEVQWIAEKDNRTCEVCWERDGKIYPIRELPPKPHPNCRCTIRRVSAHAKVPYPGERSGDDPADR